MLHLGLCIVWMIRYDTYRDTFDPIHDTYRRYVSDQIYDVTRHIFDKLVCTMLFITSALLRLECTIDCISGSPPKCFSVHFLTMSAYPHILKKKKKKIN